MPDGTNCQHQTNESCSTHWPHHMTRVTITIHHYCLSRYTSGPCNN